MQGTYDGGTRQVQKSEYAQKRVRSAKARLALVQRRSVPPEHLQRSIFRSLNFLLPRPTVALG